MSKAAKNVTQAVVKAIDPLRPEWEKKLTGSAEQAVGIKPGSIFSGTMKSEASPAAAPEKALKLAEAGQDGSSVTAQIGRALTGKRGRTQTMFGGAMSNYASLAKKMLLGQ